MDGEGVGEDVVDKAADTVAQHGFDGAPDLVLYHPAPPRLWCVEVKSATDKLRSAQLRMLQGLSQIDGVTCQICSPRSALKRFSNALDADFGSDESDR